jgi:hypothetical protein
MGTWQRREVIATLGWHTYLHFHRVGVPQSAGVRNVDGQGPERRRTLEVEYRVGSAPQLVVDEVELNNASHTHISTHAHAHADTLTRKHTTATT